MDLTWCNHMTKFQPFLAMIKIIDHEEFGKVLFDTETQQYEYPVLKEQTMFNYNGRRSVFFESFKDFLESKEEKAVIPVVCVSTDIVKRRTSIDLYDINNYVFKFFNVEMINCRWTENDISKANKGKSFFCLLRKNREAVNDCILLSLLEIKKGGLIPAF